MSGPHRTTSTLRATDSRTAPGSSGTGLALTAAEAKEMMDLTSAYVLGFQEAVTTGGHPASYLHDSLDLLRYEQGRRVCEELREDAVPESGTDLRTLLDELFGKATANGTMHAHPGFMAHIPSGGLFQGALGEFIARSMNRFAGVWAAAPGFVQLESNVIRWFCSMLGYGNGSFGYLTTGGSIATLMGLVCALRRNGEPSDDVAPTVYASAQGHYSIQKAAGIAGIPLSRFRSIDVRADYSMDVALLAERIQQDRDAGLSPACVVATAGTTNTGAVDDLPALAALCREQGVWFHVDACFGGFFRLTRRGKQFLRGIEEADSISVDAHKSLFLPHGVSAVLVKERERLRHAFEIPGAAYLPGFVDGQELVDFCNFGPELSREFRGLTAWLPLKLHGVGAFEQCLDEKLDLAVYLAERLGELDGVQCVQRHALNLPIVNFKLSASLPEEEERLNTRLAELICSFGRTYVTTTRLPGHGLVVRACILHHRTNREVVDQLIGDVKASVSRLRA